MRVCDREGGYLFRCGDERVLRVYRRPNGVTGILDHAGQDRLWFPLPADRQAGSLPGTHRFAYLIENDDGDHEWWLFTVAFDEGGHLAAVNGQECSAG